MVESEDLALALVDVDEMKEINDRSGHLHGDGVLQTVGRLLRSQRIDDEPFRIGGDEFAILLPRTSQEKAEALMERRRADVVKIACDATVSIGVACLRAGDHAPESLQRRADAALYAARNGPERRRRLR